MILYELYDLYDMSMFVLNGGPCVIHSRQRVFFLPTTTRYNTTQNVHSRLTQYPLHKYPSSTRLSTPRTNP